MAATQEAMREKRARMVQVTVFITEEQHEEYQKLADEEYSTFSQVARKGLSLGLKALKKKR